MRTISEIFSYTGEEEENHSPNQKEKTHYTHYRNAPKCTWHGAAHFQITDMPSQHFHNAE